MNVALFLRTLGRGCDEFIDCFPTWDHLFLLKGRDMKLLGTFTQFIIQKKNSYIYLLYVGIPIANRRWILHWVEQYLDLNYVI